MSTNLTSFFILVIIEVRLHLLNNEVKNYSFQYFPRFYTHTDLHEKRSAIKEAIFH